LIAHATRAILFLGSIWWSLLRENIVAHHITPSRPTA
jgi:hypothetical protein